VRAGRRSPGRAVDWAAVRERLDRARSGTDDALALPSGRARAIMDERARALAQPPEEVPPAGEVMEVLAFSVGGERYAVETAHVRGVVRLDDLTPVPGTPGYLLGVANLRGEILAVVDLRALFGLAPGGLTGRCWVVVVGAGRPELGLLADEAGELVVLRRGEVLQPPEAKAAARRELLLGVTGAGLGVFDGAALLQDPRLFVDQTETTETTASA